MEIHHNYQIRKLFGLSPWKFME